MNENWAKALIKGLVEADVRYFCLAPGSRNTPLIAEAARHPSIKTLVHFDERGLGFHALGYAKATRKPVALIITSGSAVGNLYPAVMEAYESNLPLILLTADRPPELRSCSANQTTDQVKIFGSFVHFSFDLPCFDADSLMALPSILTQALQAVQRGPVQLNCMFREPFFDQQLTPTLRFSHLHNGFFYPDPSLMQSLSHQIIGKKGIIILGQIDRVPKGLDSLSKALNWPILADVLSRQLHKNSIRHYEWYLSKVNDVDCVLHFGNRFTSKKLLQWLEEVRPNLYAHIDQNPSSYDPTHCITDQISCDTELFCANLKGLSETKGWFEFWKEQDEQMQTHINETFASVSEWTEPYFFHHLSNHFPQDTALFIANSMPIRDADRFFFPSASVECFGNRGLSGIDGNIATAIGLAQGLKKSVIAILGDLAFLHDCNSLAQLKDCKYPVKFFVFNNSGGGIFSRLPVAKHKDFFSTHLETTHNWSFSSLANQFLLHYFCLENLCALPQCNESCVIEIMTNTEKNIAITHEIHTQISLSRSLL